MLDRVHEFKKRTDPNYDEKKMLRNVHDVLSPAEAFWESKFNYLTAFVAKHNGKFPYDFN